MSKKKSCSCGRIIGYTEICPCKQNQNRNEYQRNYYEKNKEILRPLTSTRWRKLRSLIIKRDGGLCQRCLLKYGIINGSTLQVHHIKPRIQYPELMWEETNLITLCKTCNLQIGTNDELDFKPNDNLKDRDFDFKL